nr:hypothetical protein [Candidatus Gracilibacteria bacterium]
MKIKSKLIKRVALGKAIGLVFGGIAFFVIPYIFNNSDLFLRFGVWLWYITLGAFVGIFGVMNNHPFFKMDFPFWVRGIALGGWMNFILALFIYNNLVTLMQNTVFEGYSPFCLIFEGMLFGLIVDYFATKYFGEGKELVESKK